jgi:hypothetical protein
MKNKRKIIYNDFKMNDRVLGVNATQHNFRIFLTDPKFLKTCHMTSCWSKNSNKNMEFFQPLCRE